MIPVQLSVKNFMCYRDGVPPLNFERFRMACLSGDNGHGKSALLDAMTWALWGRSRAGSNDELVSLGQTEMSVEFEFDVHPNRYRLIRRFRSRSALKRPGQSTLDLFVASNGQYQPLTSGVEETEKKVTELLKLDYDTFVNSAFLRQGKADEFTRKTPAKRKEILASILNLSIYDRLEEKAKEARNLKLQEHLRVQALIDSNKKEIGKKAEYSEQKDLVEQSEQRLSLEMNSTRKELEKAREERKILEMKEGQAAQMQENLVRLKKDEAACRSRVERHGQRISQFLQLINRKSDIEKSFSKYLSVREQELSLTEKLAVMMRLREKKSLLQATVEREEGRLKQTLSHHSRTVQELREKIAGKPDLLSKGGELQKSFVLIQEKAKELQTKANLLSECKQRTAASLAERKRLSELMDDLREKASFIKKGDEKCPLCGSALGQDGLMQIEGHYREEIQLAEKSLKGLDEGLRSDSNRARALSGEIEGLEKKLETERRLHVKEESLLQKALQEVQEAESKLPEEAAAMETLTRRLETGDYAGEQKQAILLLDKEMNGIAYDEALHKSLRSEAAGLENFQKEKFLLDEAERDLGREQAEEQQAQDELKEKVRQMGREDGKLKELARELFSLPEVKASADGLARSLENKELEKGKLHHQLGGLEENLRGCMAREKENQRLELDRAAHEHEIKIYDGLAAAFGKRGVQALVIETTLPEIGAEANDLLSRLTDGRMSLQLEMRPESPGGKITESLEIKIADELGTRNYEMFSGGEAFRIDFALRIALSKYLARRAGAPLSLLIIDEGFGSQDETGRLRLIDALKSIQEDFDKMLVITHIPEMKEYFPYRINVTKTGEGSTISLEEG